MCQIGGAFVTNRREGESAMKVTTVGLDLAKQVFSVHGVDEHGRAAYLML